MGIGKLTLDNYKPLRDVVFDNIRNAILDGTLSPGKRLMEIQLAEQLGVSRTPVREAIRKLELEGLVIMVPRKGAYVASISKKELLDILELRIGLEAMAARLAADRISDDEIKILEDISMKLEESIEKNNLEDMMKYDEQFHSFIFETSGNVRLQSIMASMWEPVYNKFRLKYMSDYSSAVNIVEEHKNIVKALKKGDKDLAEKLAKVHIETSEQFMIDNLMQED